MSNLFFFSSTAINWSVGQMEVMYSDLRDRPARWNGGLLARSEVLEVG